MKLASVSAIKTSELSGLSVTELLSVVAGLQQQLAAKSDELEQRDQVLEQRDQVLEQRDQTLEQRNHYIQILEELLRWKRVQQFAASSEKSAHQHLLFDEVELEIEIDALRDQLPDDVEEEDAPRTSKKHRHRGFSDQLLRERIELTLSEEEK